MKNIHINVYRTFHNGIAQQEFLVPANLKWVRSEHDGNVSYWTILSCNDKRKIKGNYHHEYILGMYQYIWISDIEPHDYFESRLVDGQEVIDSMGLHHKTMACVNDRLELVYLARFGRSDSLNIPTTFIQFKSGGIESVDRFAIIHDPKFGVAFDPISRARWIEVDSDRAGQLWDKSYDWVYNKIKFIDKPCPILLNAGPAKRELAKVLSKMCSNEGEFDVSIFQRATATYNAFFAQFNDNEPR